MVEGTSQASGAQPPAGEGPEIRKPDVQLLLQDHAQAWRGIYEERRNGERRLAEERERARWEVERVRAEYGEKLRRASLENDALIGSIGRLRDENDHLREENLTLKLSRQSNGHAEPKAAERPEAAASVPPPAAKLTVVPPIGPPLGKSVPLSGPPDKI